MHKSDVLQCEARLDFYLDVPSNDFSQQVSITTCFDRREISETVHCFSCLWQVSSKSCKDARTRENAWKEVASQVIEQTANRNNI